MSQNQNYFLEKLSCSSQADGSYIITGPAGVGKNAFTKKMIQLLVDSKNLIANATTVAPQLEKKRGKSREKAITVEQVRTALEFMNFKSPEASYMVCLIKKAEKMKEGAQNALLKSLEEPKRGNVFLLVTESEEKLLPTIRSRSFILRLGLTHPNQIYDQLLGRGISPKTAQKIAYFSWGKPKTAQSITQNKASLLNLEKIKADLEKILAAPLWEKFNLLEKESQNQQEVLKKIDRWLVILTASLEANLTPNFPWLAKETAIHYNKESLIETLTNLLELRKKIKTTNASPRLALEAAFLEL